MNLAPEKAIKIEIKGPYAAEAKRLLRTLISNKDIYQKVAQRYRSITIDTDNKEMLKQGIFVRSIDGKDSLTILIAPGVNVDPHNGKSQSVQVSIECTIVNSLADLIFESLTLDQKTALHHALRELTITLASDGIKRTGRDAYDTLLLGGAFNMTQPLFDDVTKMFFNIYYGHDNPVVKLRPVGLNAAVLDQNPKLKSFLDTIYPIQYSIDGQNATTLFEED